ncbi:glycosyltransferase family 2 protein [Dyadobacter sediminis]|uniref:Glycosyltransferase family 2 protein n=1 Tax=Dyadobacter sediminis TaxID=1493691 RepID=A0A5R9KB86_9BACT|nr:glycosyltransferase family A protein [Dyadobacter sediminis]TLU92066.1 glycosyltransferase family 2 protein [Dyadobacter sediminis]GGB97718.1 hypothetical protein GCM10011325_26310 [Dyadobacter sediminis]
MQLESSSAACLFNNEENPPAICQVCVVVPVRNEAGSLYQTLEALRRQTDQQQQPLDPASYEVLVLVNNSTDHSFQIASEYARDFPAFRLIVENIHLPAHQAHIGTVRRLLMDRAYTRLMRSNNLNGIIASTDGDTIVDHQWVHHIIAEIACGNDAVGGRILTRKKAGSARLYHLRDVTYRCLLSQAESILDPQVHNPFPCHFQYFGANMAVTCKMYEQAGRLPILPFLEDAAFHKALLHQDARIRKSFKVKVYTSARTNGRVSVGFSEQLKKWKEDQKNGQAQLVEAVAPLLVMFNARSRLRRCWYEYHQNQIILYKEIDELAHSLQVQPAGLQNSLIRATLFGELWESVVLLVQSDVNYTVRFQPIQQAIMQLRMFVKNPGLTVSETNPDGMSFPLD